MSAAVCIDLAALTHNMKRAREAAPAARIMAMIKANAYGHGLVRVAAALDADGFGVARIDEALELRAAGIERPVLVLAGPGDRDELQAASRAGLTLAVHEPGQVELIARTDLPRPVKVWLKVDTGMHRLGFEPQRIAAVWRTLAGSDRVDGVPVLMTHLANADDRRDAATTAQLETFRDYTEGLAAPRSVANSAGVLGWPQTHADWVRPGIMLYGASPFIGGSGQDHSLAPVMTFRTRLLALNQIPRGGAIGYGGEWVCPHPMRVGVAAVGYGDGYPRHAPSGTPVLVNGRRAPLVGRVSMDLICIDLRDQPQARVGDPVVLWGEGLPVEDVAASAGTIGYELLCRIAPRVRVSERGGGPARAAY